jgi:nucleotide-binding universal stress UspA family protein
MSQHHRIVVAVDGSPASRRALAWAIDHAAGRPDTVVEAVHVWHPPYVTGYPFVVPVFDPGEIERAARATLESAVDGSDAATRGVAVEPILASGSPVEVLLDAAKGADLLVAGTRGLGGFTGMLLGSVSHHLVHHAPCPVLIVPGPDTP